MGLTSKPTPHHTPLDDDPLECLRLIRSRRVGPVTWHRLMAEHGTAKAALAALPEIARSAGVENYAICPLEVARHEMAQARLAGAVMLAHPLIQVTLFFLNRNSMPLVLPSTTSCL